MSPRCLVEEVTGRKLEGSGCKFHLTRERLRNPQEELEATLISLNKWVECCCIEILVIVVFGQMCYNLN